MIWKPPLRRLTIGLTLTVVATAFEALSVATVLPATLRELGDLTLYGWTFSAFLLANLIGISVGGSESARVGLARLFVVGVVLFSVGLGVSGAAGTMSVIVAGRVLQGFGAGLLYTTSYAAIAQAYAVELQPSMLATLSSAWVIPGLVGPGLASLIAEHASWRWVFLGLVPPQLLAAALVVPALRALPPIEGVGALEPRSDRIRLAVQLGIGAAGALAGIGMRGAWLGVLLAITGGALALHALRRLTPPGTLLARPGLPAAIASMALITFAFFGTEAFVPLALDRIRHAPVALAGFALTGAALTWTAGAWLPVRLSARFARRTIIGSGLTILGAGVLGTLALLSPDVPPISALLVWAVAGFGMGLAFTTTSAAILESAGPGGAGVASASLQLSQTLGAALATGLGGVVVAAPFAGDPPTLGIAIVDAIMACTVLLALVTSRRIS